MRSSLSRLFLVLGICASAALARDEKNASSSGAVASSQSRANLEAEIARIDDERRNAYLQNDAATLDRILADDVSVISGIGSEDGEAAIESPMSSLTT